MLSWWFKKEEPIRLVWLYNDGDKEAQDVINKLRGIPLSESFVYSKSIGRTNNIPFLPFESSVSLFLSPLKVENPFSSFDAFINDKELHKIHGIVFVYSSSFATMNDTCKKFSELYSLDIIDWNINQSKRYLFYLLIVFNRKQY